MLIFCDGEDHSEEFNIWLANRGGMQAADACSELTWSTDPPNPELNSLCGGTSNVDVIFIATDDCGNSISSTADFRIVDVGNPTWEFIPEDITISCDEEALFGTPIAIDSCSTTTLEFWDEEFEGDFCDNPSYIIRSWVARDECQWETTTIATQKITFVDDAPPVLTPVHDLSLIHI